MQLVEKIFPRNEVLKRLMIITVVQVIKVVLLGLQKEGDIYRNLLFNRL